jgi:NADP-dependent 3-hydroxy acid dehydrogenase YdfG
VKKAIIVGATSGIGLEVAKLLLAEGWTLGLAGRRVELLEPLRQEFPDRVLTASIDVTLPTASVAWMTLA